MKKTTLLIAVLLLIFSLTANSATGWLKKRRKGYIYFKPFVTVNSPDVVVIFITSEGKVYRGVCRKKKFIDTCTVTPGKHFDSPYTVMRYIVLEISPPYAPKILRTGTVSTQLKEN
ncbi:hypothetical protein [Desulfurobacterium indicum]|uniref:NusG domain-containing protein n=1 Tax=Desulfurobacterium indicum TaxID=1914305 RepID=A0A1R1MLR8_9BACT|nr:hypothetical protein [Desulfurobacterium indicum]OMH40703.1 hypothetical protein BLW93_03770 [Desulfurobacterium indicum]